MTDIILTCEYILSPINAAKDKISNQIDSLIEVYSLISDKKIEPYIECDLINKIIKLDQFPTEGSIKSNLINQGVSIYSAKDISKIINNIISKISKNLDSCFIEWEDGKIIEKEFSEKIIPQREESIIELIDQIIIKNKSNNDNIHLIYFNNSFKNNTIEVTGKIKSAVYGDNYFDPKLDKNFDADKFTISTSHTHEIFHKDMKSLELYKKSESSSDILFSIKSEIINQRINFEELGISNIYFGNDFLESCKINQCIGEKPFSNVAFEKIIFVLKNYKSGKLGYFHTYAGSGVQKTKGDAKAYREHITESGVALRLMFWMDEKSNIEFSNIGPKKEEIIFDPDFI